MEFTQFFSSRGRKNFPHLNGFSEFLAEIVEYLEAVFESKSGRILAKEFGNFSAECLNFGQISIQIMNSQLGVLKEKLMK
jgi:hypothetical protein